MTTSVAQPAPRNGRTAVTTLLLLLALLSGAARPTHAAVYRATLDPSQYPATYAAAHPTTLAIRGLYDACSNVTDPTVSKDGRGVLNIYSPNITSLLAAVVPTGQVYLGGFYVPNLGTYDGWCWDVGTSTICPGLFCSGPTCTRFANTTIPLDWAAGYPKMQTGTSVVGTLKYMAYDAALQGWINVDGTTALDGVACAAGDVVKKKKKSFPWWAILIIVLGSAVIIAVVVTIVVCCCCCRKTTYTDDEDEAAFRSRDGSFSSRCTSHGGSSSTFSSRGSSHSGTSKSSGVAGSTTDSDSHLSASSSAASSSRGSR